MKGPLVVLILVGLLGLDLEAHAVVLVNNGVPVATIVRSSKPTAIEAEAARQLQAYIKMMSGATLPIRNETGKDGVAVLMGRTTEAVRICGRMLNDTRLGYDGIILKTFGNKIVVLGNKGQGQLYAVYELLKRLGCRFYLPHPDGEVVPAKSTIEIQYLNYIHKPDFAFRLHWNNGYVQPYLSHPEWYSNWSPRVYQGGIKLEYHHNYFDQICPPDKYFASHPEYFALRTVNGQTVRVSTGQLCLSNPGVVDLAVNAAKARFNDPDLMSFSLSPNDNGGWCECTNCKAMDSTNPAIGVAWRVMKFNNQIAAALASRYPTKMLAYYAQYNNLPGPPVGMTAHAMVLPIIVNDFDTMHSVYQDAAYLNVFDKWEPIAGKLMAREYYQLAKAPGLPSPMLYTVGERMRFYRDQGVIAYSGEVLGRCPVNDLSIYVSSQMLWDADQDPVAIRNEFYSLYFAEAAVPMQQYYDMLHEASFYSYYHGPYVPWNAWTASLISRLRSKLNQAYALATQDVVIRRLNRELKSLDVTDLCATAYRLADLWNSTHSETYRTQALQKIDEAVNYLNGIAAEDIVAQHRIIYYLEQLRTSLRS